MEIAANQKSNLQLMVEPQQVDLAAMRLLINQNFKHKIPADYSGFQIMLIPYKFGIAGERKLVIIKKAHGNRGHRIYIRCCNRDIPAGRYVQHRKSHKEIT